ncbi:MAG: hypothetical protein IT430_06935 [Phycisphaerales bacterium]|nr:hypothetical protein [Phycisphaerales bacterium]
MTDIGDGGVVVGSADLPSSIWFHPMAWSVTHGIQPLEMLSGTVTGAARAVNDQPWPGAVMGGYCNVGQDYATLWIGRTVTQIGGARSGVSDINNFGHAVGSAYNQFNVPRPTLWRDGQMFDIGGDPPNATGYAYGINDLTEAVGNATTLRTAFYWRDGVTTYLPEPYPPCGLRKARAINNDGIIVGQAADAACNRIYATVWVRDEHFQPYLLNDHIPRYPGVRLITADDVNDAGQVASYGENIDGDGRGYLVTPYLFEMSDPVPGRAGTENTITVTGLQPDQRLVLVWGTQEGAQKIRPDCPGGTLLIRDPHALPMARADENGIATITMFIPPYARGRTIRLQAIAPFECEISHTVTWTFE